MRLLLPASASNRNRAWTVSCALTARTWRYSSNDRLLAPNHDATREAVQSDFQAFFQKLFHGSEYSLSCGGDPRRLFAVSVKASRPFPIPDLLANLDS